MDQHPIPQDVTGFQFKLIGTMTVKQFGYVASGVIMAVILYYLPINSAIGILLKVILIPLLGSSGVIVAFVPIDGRPIDLMATNFAKAVFSPNQYVYHRQGRQLSFSSLSFAKAPTAKKAQEKAQTRSTMASKQLDQKEEKLRALLLNSRGRVQNDIDKKEAAFLKTLVPAVAPVPAVGTPQPVTMRAPQVASPLMTKPLPMSFPKAVIPPAPPIKQQIMTAAPAPTPSVLPPKGPDDLSKKETELTQALSQAKQEESISTTPAAHTVAQQKITTLSQQIQVIHSQKQQLEQELSHLQNQLATQKGVPTPLPIQPPTPGQPLQDPQHVRVIPQDVTKKAGLPHISDSPNVVVGIVKDPRGNILPNMLVEVKDKDGNPVRAFKTNQLGQFASATPLSPGTYTIELEDPKKQQRFDVIQITANNQILLPIEIISHDAREELRKQLFAN
jgi:hypothetical protein